MATCSALRFGLALGVVALCACNQGATDATSSEPAASQPAATEEKVAAKEPNAPAETESTDDGYDIIRAKTKSGETADIAVKAPPGWQVVQPPSTPDPQGSKFTLKEALAGLGGKGKLVATLRTSLGTLHCDLYDDKAPVTVANFVGLARGTRKTWDGATGAWVGRPYYDGTTFHRVIPGFMIQGGDYAGTGAGRMWYTIPDELHPSLKHDRAGLLCMANRGPNTNEAQFFITDAATPHLDTSYSIFGLCTPTEVVYRIARVPQGRNNRPLTPVVIEQVSIARVAGGAAQLERQSKAAAEPLPKNELPGVVPPGRAVRADEPPAK
jgi:peptidyl-prolyl cis-trans isomerase A (cyclophilin A)